VVRGGMREEWGVGGLSLFRVQVASLFSVLIRLLEFMCTLKPFFCGSDYA